MGRMGIDDTYIQRKKKVKNKRVLNECIMNIKVNEQRKTGNNYNINLLNVYPSDNWSLVV